MNDDRNYRKNSVFKLLLSFQPFTPRKEHLIIDVLEL